MRIVGGQWGGRPLVAPKGDAVRPTSDRVREALFNILGDLSGASVLDACSGTGAVALEALSRGAARAVAIERDPRALAAIEKNKASLGARELEVVARELTRALPALSGRRFELVFCDPPWRIAPELGAAVLAAAPALLTPEGRVVLEHAARDPSPSAPPGLSLRDARRYGDTALSFYSLQPAEPA